MSRPPVEHGTYAGYQKHRRNGETACTPCATAASEYMRNLRHARPDVRARAAWYNSTRARAQEELTRRHRAEFGEILAGIREAGTGAP